MLQFLKALFFGFLTRTPDVVWGLPFARRCTWTRSIEAMQAAAAKIGKTTGRLEAAVGRMSA